MVWQNKVVWQEGMFLRAQHFQQQDRYFSDQLQARAAPLRPYPWGLTELSIDRNLLAAGRLAISSAAGVLEDGTPFSIPHQVDPPVPLDLPLDLRDAVVFLALPLHQDGNLEVTLPGAGLEAGAARYELRNFEATDTHSDSTLSAEVGVGKLRLRFLLESDERAGYSCLGIVRVVEVPADRRAQLDDRYVPPCMRISASSVLANFISELMGMLGQRAEALAGRLGQPDARGVADVQDFLLLQTINRWHPLVAHWANAGNLHPEHLYSSLVQMAGELATFTTTSHRASLYPPYQHNDLQRTFSPVVLDLRTSLSTSIKPTAIAIALRPPDRFNVRVGLIVPRTLIQQAQFVMAVSANVPGDQLRIQFPKQVKIGAVEQIIDLVNTGVGGIGVRALPVAPRQIPFHAGHVYFELANSGEHWERLNTSGGIAIHVSANFPDLRVELWAIPS